mmetsp:Transcript_16776/g.52264  ORF Transcript_16776/g.52264 Transcript_16776/m.52264 type:complete len:637 (-) Transcript_16776:33-1943(-)
MAAAAQLKKEEEQEDADDKALRDELASTSATEAATLSSKAGTHEKALGVSPLLAKSRGERGRSPPKTPNGSKRTMFSSGSSRKDRNEDDGGGAPVGRLRLSTADLLGAMPYRTWYRLEDETGMTHMLCGLTVRYWDPVPRVPVYKYVRKDYKGQKKQTEAEKERALLGSTVVDEKKALEASKEVQKSIGSVMAKLTSQPCPAKARVNLLGKLLYMLGCSTAARAERAGASWIKAEAETPKKKKKSDDEGSPERGGVLGAMKSLAVDRMDPIEAQARVSVPDLLKRKAEMVRQGVLEECVACLAQPKVRETAAALLCALVTFPRALVARSSDVHRCMAQLQTLVRGLGVLDFVEEAADCYSSAVQGAGGSAKDKDDDAANDADGEGRTIDVHYDDGQKEKGVPAGLCRPGAEWYTKQKDFRDKLEFEARSNLEAMPPKKRVVVLKHMADVMVGDDAMLLSRVDEALACVDRSDPVGRRYVDEPVLGVDVEGRAYRVVEDATGAALLYRTHDPEAPAKSPIEHERPRKRPKGFRKPPRARTTTKTCVALASTAAGIAQLGNQLLARSTDRGELWLSKNLRALARHIANIRKAQVASLKIEQRQTRRAEKTERALGPPPDVAGPRASRRTGSYAQMADA